MRKKFDAVKFQRKVREELGKKYSINREEFLRELKEKYRYYKGSKLARTSDNSTHPVIRNSYSQSRT